MLEELKLDISLISNAGIVAESSTIIESSNIEVDWILILPSLVIVLTLILSTVSSLLIVTLVSPFCPVIWFTSKLFTEIWFTETSPSIIKSFSTFILPITVKLFSTVKLPPLLVSGYIFL